MKYFLLSLYSLLIFYGNTAYAQTPNPDESDGPPSSPPSIKEICALPTPAIIEIHTKDRTPVQSKEVYIDAQITIRGETLSDNSDAIENTFATRIRGRGNSTWRMEKKPYRLNLNEARSLLGLPAARNWALLANHADKTMLRNAVALCLGRVMGMEWTPGFRFAELYLNDEYQGLYQLTDHIETGEHRVNIGARKEPSVPGDIGFLMEIDKHDKQLDETQWFLGNIFGTPYTVKGKLSPEEAVEAAAFINRMELGFIKKKNAYFLDIQNHPNFINYKDYIELESFVNFYLINEFLKNLDAFFYSSTFVYRPWGEKLRFGPLWDFDSAAGNADEYGMEDPHGWWTREISVYVQHALSDPEFNNRVKDRWNFLYARIPELFDFIDSAATGLDEAQKRNFEKWPILDRIVWRNPEIHYTYDKEVAHLKYWLQRRALWIHSELFFNTTQ